MAVDRLVPSPLVGHSLCACVKAQVQDKARDRGVRKLHQHIVSENRAQFPGYNGRRGERLAELLIDSNFSVNRV